MKAAIYKYNLTTSGGAISVPVGAKLLDVQLQRNHLVAWFLVNTEESVMKGVIFRFVYTGMGLPDSILQMKYIKTIQINDEEVIHVLMDDN